MARCAITMGKGDGKKKRKKKSTADAAPQPQVAAPAPLRVMSDSNISVKRQIRWAKMKKEYASGGTAFRQRNAQRVSYRKSLGKYFMLTLTYHESIMHVNQSNSVDNYVKS